MLMNVMDFMVVTNCVWMMAITTSSVAADQDSLSCPMASHVEVACLLDVH